MMGTSGEVETFVPLWVSVVVPGVEKFRIILEFRRWNSLHASSKLVKQGLETERSRVALGARAK